MGVSWELAQREAGVESAQKKRNPIANGLMISPAAIFSEKNIFER